MPLSFQSPGVTALNLPSYLAVLEWTQRASQPAPKLSRSDAELMPTHSATAAARSRQEGKRIAADRLYHRPGDGDQGAMPGDSVFSAFVGCC
jgi:hypothetical protein